MQNGMQILVAEASLGEAQRLVRALKIFSRPVQVATSGEQILELLRRVIFQEAIVAVELDIEHESALAHLAALPTTRLLLAVGPPGDMAMEMRGRTAGADAYLTRPVTPQTLAAALRGSVLSHDRGSSCGCEWLPPQVERRKEVLANEMNN